MSKWIRFLLLALLLLGMTATALAQEDIDVGDTVEGGISDEVYEYEIELEEGQVIEISIRADWDTYLEVYDGNDEILAYNDDGGDGLQSRIVFVAPYTGKYVILVREYSGEIPAGDYELTVESIQVINLVDGGQLEYGEDEDIDADDALAVEATFEGEAGDIINIVTLSDDYLNTVMTLFDPQGNEIMVSDSYYGDAAIQRFELADSGTYTIRIEESQGGILDGDIEIEIELTDILTLDDGDITVEIGDGTEVIFVNFSAEEDVFYELTLRLDDEPSYSDFTVYILEESQNLSDYSEYSIRMAGGMGISYVFEAPDDGEFVIRLEYYGSDDIEVTLSIEEVEE